MSNISDFLGSVGGSSRTYTVSDLGSPTGNITLDLSSANVFKFDMNNTVSGDLITFSNIPTDRREEGWLIIDYGTSDLKRLITNTEDIRNILSSEITLADDDYTFFDKYWDVDGSTLFQSDTSLGNNGTVNSVTYGNVEGQSSTPQFVYSIDSDFGVVQYSSDLEDISQNMSIRKTRDTIAQGDSPTSVNFNTDGTKMYVSINDSSGNKNSIYEYGLSTAWEVDTATFSQEAVVDDKQLSLTYMLNVYFNPNGYEYITLQTNSQYGTGYLVKRYKMSSQWDSSTGSLVSSSIVQFVTEIPSSMTFKPDGTRLYLSFSDNRISCYSLNVPWDVSTANLIQSYDGSGDGINSINGMCFVPGTSKNGNLLISSNDGTGEIHQLNTGNKYEILKYKQYQTDKILLMRGQI